MRSPASLPRRVAGAAPFPLPRLREQALGCHGARSLSVGAAGGSPSPPRESGCCIFPPGLRKDPNAEDGAESRPPGREAQGRQAQPSHTAPSTLVGSLMGTQTPRGNSCSPPTTPAIKGN